MTLSPATDDSKASNPIRVMVVDDSAVIRGLITRMLEEDAEIKVVSSVGNGEMAVNAMDRHRPDVVVLDIEMPVMDGITALPKILEKDPHVKVIMASTLTLKNAEVSIQCMENGAADYVPKPSSNREIGGASDFKRDLVQKVKSLGEARRRAPGRVAGRESSIGPRVGGIGPKKDLFGAKPVVLRKPGLQRPEILAIGSSTGGPQALFSVLKGLHGKISLPIMITQHMPATFTSILADHINRMTGWACAEAVDNQALKPGRIYLAPGGYHMLLKQSGMGPVLKLNQDEPENFCRPSVDPMFRSISEVYGAKMLGVILTGMGSDGARGGKVVVDAGGTIIAQDEKTSVVWGMPGAAATSGICSAVVPLEEIPSQIIKVVQGNAR